MTAVSQRLHHELAADPIARELIGVMTVSYTHLTLPTILLV